MAAMATDDFFSWQAPVAVMVYLYTMRQEKRNLSLPSLLTAAGQQEGEELDLFHALSLFGVTS